MYGLWKTRASRQEGTLYMKAERVEELVCASWVSEAGQIKKIT